jgi:D-glycero-D-manno-heptose 1,7-bisphosphate phosphatase
MPLKQAVILCGGLGTRMKPLTDTMPKPMAPVNGHPFLEELITQLRDQGVKRFVLLTGYRSDMISDYFGDGRRLDVDIVYSQGPVDWDTGRRVWEARDAYEPQFLLLYSDNFIPFRLEKLLAFHDRCQATISFLVHPKKPGNTRLNADGQVVRYDSKRAGSDLDMVELGYMAVERDAMLALFDTADVRFSEILGRAAQSGRLAGFVKGDDYQSISDIERWRRAEKYLAVKRILLIDRDGTINVRPPGGAYLTNWVDFRLINENVDAMARLAREGFRFIVISNQAGIGRGIVDAAVVESINRKMVDMLKARGIDIMDVYICPHHWNDHCDCRKPAAGMFYRASREHLLRLDRTIYIGDDPRDAAAADNAGCLSVLVGPERDNIPHGGARPDFTSETIGEAESWIVSQFARWAAH